MRPGTCLGDRSGLQWRAARSTCRAQSARRDWRGTGGRPHLPRGATSCSWWGRGLSKPATCNPQLAIRNPSLVTLLNTLHPSITPHPTSVRHPTPYIRPSPHTLHPSVTPHPTSVHHPTPYILHLTPLKLTYIS